MRIGGQTASLLLFSLTCAFQPAMAERNPIVVVANSGDGTISVYSAETNGDGPTLRLLKVLPAGKAPPEVCMSPDGKRAYVPNRHRDETTVTVINLDPPGVAATFTDPAMKSPDGCLVSPDSSKLYVAGAWSDAVFVFSTKDG